MKILASIVLYNPDDKALNNLNNLNKCDYFDKIFISDNSLTELDKANCHDAIYHFYNKNMGIAYALRDAMNYAIENDYDYVLTLDQDSIFPFDKMKEIYEYLVNFKETNVGIVALNYNHKYNSKNEIKKVKMIITSGNFINVDNYKKIDGFNENLFIDYVDFDLCRQFYYKKIDVLVLTKYSLIQTIGNPIKKNGILSKIKIMNPTLVRYYYRFRNLKYCYKKNKIFYLKNNLKEHITIIIMLIFENNRRNKLKMIKKGKRDAKNNKLGSFEE